jgi:hypothetical protein
MCGKEFNNSDELKQHKEEVHPMDEGKLPDVDEENPEIKREMPDAEPEDVPGRLR